MDIFCMGCMEKFSDEYQVCPYCGYIVGTKAAEALHIEPGSVLHDRYIVGRVLGFGGFGITYIGWDALLEQKVAIKEYLPSEFSTRMPGVTQVTVFNGDKKEQFRDGMKRFVDEAKRLARFHQCDGIVKVFDSFEDNNTAYIVMEYLQGETLAERLKREGTIPPEQAVEMLIPVIRSLKVVHAEGIIHRDIAPDNIFITLDGQVKLIDFGAARYATTSHSRSLTVIVKPGYSPEEQYRSRGDQGSHTDTYAIGAVLYKMITGVTPPDALERRAFFETKKKDILKPISKYCKSIDSNLETAILNAMNVRIEDRTPDMEQLENELCSEEPVKRREGRIKKIDILKWPLWAKLSVPIAAAAVITLSVLFSMGIIGFDSGLRKSMYIPEGMSRVPSIISEEIKAAEDRLEEANLLYTIVGKEYSSVIPKDLILSQDVSAGTVVLENTNVNVKISGGAETAIMPQVMGLPIDEAKDILEKSGFVVSQVEKFSMAIEKGYVISQNIVANEEAAIGSVVTLAVSKGIDPDAKIEKKEIKLSDLVGKSYDEVLAIAESSCFKLSVSSREYSTEYAINEIISQSPHAGTIIETGDTVSIVISMGKKAIKVPDVQYQNKSDAQEILNALGLKVTVKEIESESVAAGLVISQSVEANTSVAPGTSITLTISKGAASFVMPNVVGMTEQDAKNTLIGKGLSVSISYQHSTEAEGTVLKQSISAKTQVTRGTVVTITVSSSKETISVPDIVGKKKSVAQSILENSGFSVTVKKFYSDTVEEDIVISQMPSEGTSQIKGNTIIITVSMGKDTVKSISVASNPKKTNYFKGEILDSTGLTLNATYRSGKVESVSGGFVCSPMQLNTVGTQKITVTYSGCTASFNVTVSDVFVSGISIKTKPTKVSYTVGDSLKTAGLALTVKYNNGKVKTVNTGYSCTPNVLSKAGRQNITVTFEGESTTFEVNVVGEWSDWTSKLPDNVDSEGYEIESKTQYSYQTVTDVHTLPDGTVGVPWGYEYSHTEYRTETGKWSSWITGDGPTITVAPPNPGLVYSYEEEKEKANQYRYRDKIEGTTEYGEWSEWQFESVSVTSNREVQVREVSRIRYIVTYSTQYYYKWSSWSSYSDDAITSNDKRRVKTRTVYRYREI